MKRATRSKLTGVASPPHLASHRREILAFCYRMTGAIHDAEDCTQEAFARALGALDTFDGRALRAWLYRIATNVCLDHLRKRARRTLPVDHGAPADPSTPLGAPLVDTAWIEPVPDGAIEYAASETIALGYVALLQRLSPGARAVLIARDVLDLSTTETAAILGISEAAVNGKLYRARAALRDARVPASRVLADVDPDVLVRFVRAWRDGDVDTIVAMLRADAVAEMPPLAEWYRGRAAIRAALRSHLFADGARFELVPIGANAMPAFAMYRCTAGPAQWWGIMVLRIDRRDAVGELALFVDPRLRAAFELPESLSAGRRSRGTPRRGARRARRM
jgi:RNA polymerase sigma-70 factor, ECF subfamily